MKLEHIAFVFLFVFLVMTLTFDTKQEMLTEISLVKNRYDLILETAADDAAQYLVKVDAGGNPFIQKEDALAVFFQSLYAGFGVMGDPDAQEELRKYIPLILVMDKDGAYFWYHGTYENKGTNYKEMWSEKHPYAKRYVRNGAEYFVRYTFEDAMYLISSNEYRFEQATYESMYASHPELDFLSKENFMEERSTVIINTVTDHMTDYINTYNRIAQQNGIAYQFAIPYLSETDWNRSMNDISFLVLFQGYPYGTFTTERYNQVELSCASTKKSSKYYITKEKEVFSYHRADCSMVNVDAMQPYDSKRECALQGAFPCRNCSP